VQNPQVNGKHSSSAAMGTLRFALYYGTFHDFSARSKYGIFRMCHQKSHQLGKTNLKNLKKRTEIKRKSSLHPEVNLKNLKKTSGNQVFQDRLGHTRDQVRFIALKERYAAKWQQIASFMLRR